MLSNRDRAALNQIERQLLDEDPDFVQHFAATGPHRPSPTPELQRPPRHKAGRKLTTFRGLARTLLVSSLASLAAFTLLLGAPIAAVILVSAAMALVIW